MASSPGGAFVTRAGVGLILLLAAAAAAATAEEPPGVFGFTIAAERVEAREGPRGNEAYLEENVTVTRGEARLVGDRGVYYESEGLAVVFGGVTGVDGTSTIACDTLKYFRDMDLAVLIGNAAYTDSAGVTTADVIEVYRRERLAVAYGEAAASDTDGTTRLTSGRIVYDFDRREGRATDGPILRTFTEGGEPDATLGAVVIEFDRGADRVLALGDATIERGDVTAASRVAVIEGEDDHVLLTGDPTVRQGEDVLRGERILVFAKDGEISRVVATGRARATYHIEGDEPSDPVERGHVEGDTLTMFFEGGEPILTTVRGSAASEHAVGVSGERNAVSSRRIDVMFTEGEILRVVFRGAATGAYTFVAEEDGRGGERAEAPAVVEAPPLGPAPADSVALETVSYAAERIDYYVARNRIVLSDGARVEYKDTALEAGEVVFDPDDQVLSASRSPDLFEGGERLVGAGLAYDLERRSGTVDEGVTTFEDGLYYGERIERQSDGTLAVGGGVYTTCSAPEPHYRLVSHRMKIYLDDKVVAKPVVLYIGKIPVLALPFYVFPIRKERHSGFLIPQLEFGIMEGEGRFVRNFGYYWAPSDYWDLTVWGDYYEQTKWIGHVEGRYKIRYVLSGSFETSFLQELQNSKRRWDLKLSHRQELGRHWTAGASGDFRSDEAYASDSFQTIEESVNRSLHSQLWVRGRWSGLSLGVTLDRREELDRDTVSELLPKVDVSGSQRPVLEVDEEAEGLREWLGAISYSWSARAVNDRDRSGDELSARQGLGASGSIRGTGKLLGWLNLSPRLNVRQDWYDRDKRGREFAGRLTYDASLTARTTVYGTFYPGLGPVEGVRHIVEPSASFSWTPEFSDYFDDGGGDLFPTFTGFGGTPRSRKAVSLSLVNKLQLKLEQGEETRKLDNLLRLSMSSSYDFKKDDRRWSDLTSRLEVRPGTIFSIRWDTRHDPYDWSIENSSVTTGIDLTGAPALTSLEPWEDRIAGAGGSPVDELRRELADRARGDRPGGRPWSAAATFRYSRGADPSNSTYWADGRLAWSVTPNWRVNYSVHYDLKEQEVASQEYTIYRDLHCWEAQFTRRYYNDEWQYYFRINVKALPEIQAETGRKHIARSIR
jgi:lipopolysaccharide assembly outer membrane protein LptD (OstA)